MFLVATVACACLCSRTAAGQETLYDNGPDGNVGYYKINYSSVTTNSFQLQRAAVISQFTLTIYDVDDRNVPQHLKWSVRTEPFGGVVLGSGFVQLARLQNPYLTRFLYFAWPVGFTIPPLNLPSGTYYLQLQDVVTRWHTYAFWAQTAGGSSEGYYEAVGPEGAGEISMVPSESFTVNGQWVEVR